MSRASIYENPARQDARRKQREQEKQKRALQNAVMATLPAYNTGGNWRSGAELGEDVIIANVNEWQQKATEAAAKAEERAQSALAAESHGDMKVASVFWGDSWSYDQKAKNFSAEALRYEAMLKPPKTAPKETAPGTALKTKSPVAAAEKKRKETETTPTASGETKDWQEYLGKSVEQVVKGKYADESTLLGTAAEIGLAFTPLDVAQDLRDLSYDLTHLKTTPWHETALDALALVPVLGAVKPIAKAIKGGADAAKTASRVIETADTLTTAAKHGDDLVDAGKAVTRLAERGTAAAEEAKLTDRLMEVGQRAGHQVDFTSLDQKTIDEYTEIIQQYDEAARVQDTITYFRVQGGIKDTATGLNRSQQRIFIMADGKIAIPKKNTQLSISAYTTEHAAYFKGTRGEGTEVIAFDVPDYLDELMRENAVLAENYRSLPWNQGGTAPKIPDVNRPGYPYNIGQPWLDWLEEYAYNARYIDLGGKK